VKRDDNKDERDENGEDEGLSMSLSPSRTEEGRRWWSRGDRDG